MALFGLLGASMHDSYLPWLRLVQGFAGGHDTGPFNMQRVTSRSQLMSAKFNLASVQ